MIRFCKKKHLIHRALTVMVLACFVFWIVAQNAEKPPARSNAEVLIKQLNDLSTADKYQEVLHFSDSIVRIFEKNGFACRLVNSTSHQNNCTKEIMGKPE